MEIYALIINALYFITQLIIGSNITRGQQKQNPSF